MLVGMYLIAVLIWMELQKHMDREVLWTLHVASPRVPSFKSTGQCDSWGGVMATVETDGTLVITRSLTSLSRPHGLLSGLDSLVISGSC